MVESPTVRETVSHCLKQRPPRRVHVDLSDCHYLDSTFMGALIWLHKNAGEAIPDRLLFVADASKSHQLFSHSLLDRVLNVVPTCPPAIQEFVEISIADLDRDEFGRHIEECHRKLAELGGKDAGRFEKIADRIRGELR
jgi:hypothetical protein